MKLISGLIGIEIRTCINFDPSCWRKLRLIFTNILPVKIKCESWLKIHPKKVAKLTWLLQDKLGLQQVSNVSKQNWNPPLIKRTSMKLINFTGLCIFGTSKCVKYCFTIFIRGKVRENTSGQNVHSDFTRKIGEIQNKTKLMFQVFITSKIWRSWRFTLRWIFRAVQA